jgi:hypothetical protein
MQPRDILHQNSAELWQVSRLSSECEPGLNENVELASVLDVLDCCPSVANSLQSDRNNCPSGPDDRTRLDPSRWCLMMPLNADSERCFRFWMSWESNSALEVVEGALLNRFVAG